MSDAGNDGGKRLLVIDDEPDLVDIVVTFAEDAGFETRGTSNAGEFIRALGIFDPTVIVLDMVMPDTDGIELIQHLSTTNCRAHVVVMTGFDPKYTETAEEIGKVLGQLSISRLQKPFSRGEFLAAVGEGWG